MMRSLYSAVAGLKNHQTKMDVIGNNISNVNTVAFKSSSVTFSDIIYQTISGASGPSQTLGGVNAKQIGLGMSTAATSMAITSSGSAQTTGKPFDLRLNDAGNSTNFFVVNNGTENVFTRDGCFYIDGAGTLCMDSTCYKLMGWLAGADGQVITSGDVVPLTIMASENLTSDAEATEKAYASGIIDKDTPDLSSTSGYTMALEFFDDLGYPYSARFTVRTASDDGSKYTVKLSQILDQNGVDVLKDITEAQGIKLDQIFGSANTATYSINGGTPYVTNKGLSDLLTGTSWTYDTNNSTQYAGGIIGHLKNTANGESIYFNANGVFYADQEGKQAYTGATQDWGGVFKKTDGSSTLTHPWSNSDNNTISITSSGQVSLVQVEGANNSNILKENWYFLDTVYDTQTTTTYDAIANANVDLSDTSKNYYTDGTSTTPIIHSVTDIINAAEGNSTAWSYSSLWSLASDGTTKTQLTSAAAVSAAIATGATLYSADPDTLTTEAAKQAALVTPESIVADANLGQLYERVDTTSVVEDANGNPVAASSGWPITYGEYEYPNPAEKNPTETWGGYFINVNTNRLVAITTSGTLYEYDKNSDTYIASTLALDSMLKDFDPDTTSVTVDGIKREISPTYTNYNLTFSQADGSFAGIDDQQSVYMFTSTLGPNFHNIEIDFSALKNANNGKKSTAGMDIGTSSVDTTGSGKKLGSLTGVAVQNDGRIYGSYDNGNTVLLGQIASAHFANASGLQKIGESCYNTTLNSGEAVIGDISADGSSMTSGEIEMSNVDLSAEFTDMITTQRGFQANSRVITTSDTLLEELINLKR